MKSFIKKIVSELPIIGEDCVLYEVQDGETYKKFIYERSNWINIENLIYYNSGPIIIEDGDVFVSSTSVRGYITLPEGYTAYDLKSDFNRGRDIIVKTKDYMDMSDVYMKISGMYDKKSVIVSHCGENSMHSAILTVFENGENEE